MPTTICETFLSLKTYKHGEGSKLMCRSSYYVAFKVKQSSFSRNCSPSHRQHIRPGRRCGGVWTSSVGLRQGKPLPAAKHCSCLCPSSSQHRTKESVPSGPLCRPTSHASTAAPHNPRGDLQERTLLLFCDCCVGVRLSQWNWASSGPFVHPPKGTDVTWKFKFQRVSYFYE
jgi:hypothetical protein